MNHLFLSIGQHNNGHCLGTKLGPKGGAISFTLSAYYPKEKQYVEENRLSITGQKTTYQTLRQECWKPSDPGHDRMPC